MAMKSSDNKLKEKKEEETDYNSAWRALDPDYLWQLPKEEYYNIPHTIDMQCWDDEY
tara:strand:+ start:752 stop:922 length:171 start_codon:yes stop_codon:yes gene_type:complete